MEEPHIAMPPFTLAPIEEISLAGGSLAKVLTQVRFSRTPTLVTDEAELRLAELLPRYPVRRAGQTIDVALGAAPGEVDQKIQPVRIFADTAQAWQITVTETAVALETTAYMSREDFCTRARELFDAVVQVSVPPLVDRVGLRYVDRFAESLLDRLNDYVIPPLRVLHGIMGEGLSLEHSVSDSQIVLGDDERLKVRSGLLPPGGVFDPVLSPVSSPSWLLDLDVFTLRAGFSFEPEALDQRLRRYADHVHSFFRWAVTEAFINEFRDTSNEIAREGHG
jgi:uncharacterized protein (TIGR04255 family)